MSTLPIRSDLPRDGGRHAFRPGWRASTVEGPERRVHNWRGLAWARTAMGGTIALALTVGLGTTAAASPSYTITDLGTFGGQTSVATGINNAGQVVGYAFTPGDLTSRAFLWEDGVLKDLGTLGGASSDARDINDLGQIVGGSETTTAAVHAYLLSDGVMRDLGTLGGRRSQASRINSAGQIIGESSLTGERSSHAFLYSTGVMRDLGTLGGITSYALDVNSTGLIVGASVAVGDNPDPTYGFLLNATGMHPLSLLTGTRASAQAINDQGQIVGQATTVGAETPRAVLWDSTGIHDLGTLGGSSSNATGINAAGQVVGQSLISGDTRWHAFLHSSGVMRDLNDLIPADSGWVLEQAIDINERGQIVGVGRVMPLRNPHAFLLTPVPPAPAAPTDLSASPGPSAQMRLTWTDHSDNETAFAIWRKSDAGEWARVGVVAPNVTTYTDSGLSFNTVYAYRVRATNNTGASTWTNEAVGRVLPPAPAPPSDLIARLTAPSRVELAWTDASDNECAFAVWRKAGTADWIRIAVLAPNKTAIADTEVSPGIRYVYRVRATNQTGASAWSNEASVETPVAAPTALFVRNGAPYMVYLQWTDNSGGETGFELYRRRGNGEWSLLMPLPANQTYWIDYALQPDSVYTYRVRAIGPTGPSGWSNEIRWSISAAQ